jgi:hypothetical protein
MRKHLSKLPIILILVLLLTAAAWAVAEAGSRSSALRSGVRTDGGVVALSGDPDSPGARGDGKAQNGSATTQRRSDLWSYLSAGHWYRLIQVRLLGL